MGKKQFCYDSDSDCLQELQQLIDRVKSTDNGKKFAVIFGLVAISVVCSLVASGTHGYDDDGESFGLWKVCLEGLSCVKTSKIDKMNISELQNYNILLLSNPGRDVNSVSAHFDVRNALNALQICKRNTNCALS